MARDINLHSPVEDAMRGPVVTVDRAATLRQASMLLHDADVGTLAVMDGSAMVGILSERDIVTALAGKGDPDRVRVAEVMTSQPRYLACGEPLASAVDAMLSAGVRHLPVLDEGEPVGIVSIRDVMAAVAV